MNIAIKTIGSLVAASALVLTLTACGGAAPEETPPTTPSISVPAPVESTPVPATTEASTPAEGFAYAEADANGIITLPNGEVADCPAGTPAVLIEADGSYACTVLLDQEDIDIIWGED